MLRLPEKMPLPEKICRLLADRKSIKLLQSPGEEPNVTHTFLCQSLTSLDGSTLVLSLDRERTPLGRGLVRGLWFDRPFTVWICQDDEIWQAEAWAYRCHIVGPLFAKMRSLAQEENPENEIACAWQLAVGIWEKAKDSPPVPERIPEGIPDLHLDHPWLHGETEKIPERNQTH